ncbi:MAG: peptide ABC transporter ATP-binding protein, partial [Alphaproteobacteria bacterium]|nr:peptide ABC transporter ATP-binding protein [Alphaproteobacteria bacterium]
LQKEMGLTFLFISHDLSVVAHTCDHVAVMYLGQIVEIAPTKALFSNTRHPYTKALLSAIPHLDPDAEKTAIKLEGEIPSPINPPPGCKFHTRCSFARDRCKVEPPEWTKIDDEHFVACHFADELSL